MATVSWKNNSLGNWNTAANWSNTLVPTSADTVTIGFGSSSTTFTVTEDAATAFASTLKIDGDTQAPTNHAVTLAMVGNTLTVATTVLLNNDQSNISGFGTLSAGGAISGAGTITATGGLLNLTGAGSLSGPTLSRTSRSQNERRRPSAVRATLDDPPIHPPDCSRNQRVQSKRTIQVQAITAYAGWHCGISIATDFLQKPARVGW